MGRKPSAASPPKLLTSVPPADPSQAESFVRGVAATVIASAPSVVQLMDTSVTAGTSALATSYTEAPSTHSHSQSIDALVPAGTSALATSHTEAPRARGMVKRKRGPDAARIVAYLPAELGDRLIVHCASTRRTVSDGVVEAVRQWLDQVRT
jgi:hypothetical protein